MWTTITPRLTWDDLQQFEWIRALRGCPQDPIHHAEGDVWIHTRMVVEALLADPDFQQASEEERTILFLSALLHDVAKPETTAIDEHGRVTARGHSARGAIRARQILWDLALPFHLRESVCGLIRFHQVPFWVIDEPDLQRRVAGLSQIARCDLLTILARADMRGRIAPDQSLLLDNIELFRSYCEESGCLRQPWRFPSDHSRFLYFQREDRDIHYKAHDDTRLSVVLMSGLPGAGKDTWIHLNLGDWPVVSLDELRDELEVDPRDNQGVVVQAARERAREYLRAHRPFVWNATNVSRQMRSQTLRLLADYHARIRIVYVESSAALLWEQNRSRQMAVPPEVIRRLMDRWDVPDLTEAHQVEYVVREEDVRQIPA